MSTDGSGITFTKLSETDELTGLFSLKHLVVTFVDSSIVNGSVYSKELLFGVVPSRVYLISIFYQVLSESEDSDHYHEDRYDSAVPKSSL